MSGDMTLSQGDFVRQLPVGGVGVTGASQRPSLVQRLHIDVPLLLLLLLLTGTGLIVLYSASERDSGVLQRQCQYLLIAYVSLFALAQLKVRAYQRLAPIAYCGVLLLLLGVLLFGVGAKGAQRWLDLPGLPRFQPSEIAKLAVPLMVAWFLSRRLLPPRPGDIALVLVLVFLPTLMILKQPDLGTSLLVAASGLLVLYFAGLSWRYIGLAVALGAASLYPAWHFVLRDYQKQRVLTLLNPESDKLGAGWNIIQSKTAIGSGGWDGKGWLQGTQSHLDFLPEGHTDFIIAVLAEEFGLRGVIMLLILYALIIARAVVICVNAQGIFASLVAASLTFMFFLYILVNMGMVSGLLPVVGVPLPLVSQGGTSVIALMASFGVLMAIGTEEKKMIR